MANEQICPKCGVCLIVGAPDRHCLACLLNLALPTADDEDEFGHPIGVGDRIGVYLLLAEIGEGGCGIVYRAAQEQPVRREVAVKVIKLGMDTRGVIARFEAERQALAMMDHPNIAKVLDAGATDSGRPYFVMELVTGERITDFCDKYSLSTRSRLEIFAQVCSAVQHAHQKGVIHRDIKPSNVLVTLTDNGPTPKVIDFGIAKATGEQTLTERTVFTAHGQFLGTPAYMSPEQAGMGGTDVDTRTDIYSLGVLLYELLTGETPFVAAEIKQTAAAAVLQMIREREPMRPSARLTTLDAKQLQTLAARRHSLPAALPNEVAGDLDWIVMKALEKDRDRRYETPHRLLDDVQRYLRFEPITARPPSRAYQVQRFLRRHRAASIAIGIALSLLLCAFGISTVLYFRERDARRKSIAAEAAQVQLRTLAEANERRAKLAAAKSERIASFLTEVFRGVDPNVAMARDTTVIREVMTKAEERLGNELKDQPEVEASLRGTFGHLFINLGEFQRSETNCRIALRLEQKTHGEDSREAGLARHHLAHVLWLEEKFVEADSQERAALATFRKLGGEESPDVIFALEGVGVIAGVAGRNEEAETIHREVLAMRKRLFGPKSEPVARSLSNLGEALNAQGRHNEAEILFREALAIYSVQPENQHFFDTSYALRNLSLALIPLGKHEEAQTVLGQCLELRRKYHPKDHPDLIDTVEEYGIELNTVGKFAEAEPLLREALEMSSRRWPKEPMHWKMSVEALANSLQHLGRQEERRHLLLLFETAKSTTNSTR